MYWTSDHDLLLSLTPHETVAGREICITSCVRHVKVREMSLGEYQKLQGSIGITEGITAYKSRWSLGLSYTVSMPVVLPQLCPKTYEVKHGTVVTSGVHPGAWWTARSLSGASLEGVLQSLTFEVDSSVPPTFFQHWMTVAKHALESPYLPSNYIIPCLWPDTSVTRLGDFNCRIGCKWFVRQHWTSPFNFPGQCESSLFSSQCAKLLYRSNSHFTKAVFLSVRPWIYLLKALHITRLPAGGTSCGIHLTILSNLSLSSSLYLSIVR